MMLLIQRQPPLELVGRLSGVETTTVAVAEARFYARLARHLPAAVRTTRDRFRRLERSCGVD